MSAYSEIAPIANKITKKYDLCDHCLGRLFSKQLRLSSNKLLGKKLKKNHTSAERCYICKNLFENLNRFLKLMLEVSAPYSFTTFNVGAMIKPSVVDRDDFIRSQFKLKGIDGIKNDLTKELGLLFSRKTKTVFDRVDPEVTFTINLKEETCQIRSKFLIISGRYVKSERGLPQKQKPCDNCSGKGCRICNFHGISEFDSVEGLISQYVFKKFGGTVAKFTWIGGEDHSSLVLKPGRPFFVKLNNPLKRAGRLPSISLGPLKLSKMKIIPEFPKNPLKFISTIKIKVNAHSEISSENLKKLKDLTKNPVILYEKSGKRSEKRIFEIRYAKNSENSFSLIVKAEGGLPIKRFIHGDDVSPGISQILDTKCECLEFDFLKIAV